MKRVFCAFIAIVMFVMAVPVVNATEGELNISAPSAILVEKSTGKVIYEKNSNQRMRPASVTKIMTLILIMEALKEGQFGYGDVVTVSAYATSMGGSQVYLKEGEQMTVDEMIKCIVVSSANDACVAMAEFISGSVEEFVSRMNEKAQELGMADTDFVNCTGLEAEGHLTTAMDISIMSRELLKYDDIKKYTTIWTDTIRNGEFGLTNTNKLIRFYSGATGLKTGYTGESKYCISATAQRDGMELIAVVMGAETSDKRNADAKTMLNYGFAKYSYYVYDGFESIPVKVIKGKEESVASQLDGALKTLIEKGKESAVKCEVNICQDVQAPVVKNQKLGEISLVYNGEELAKTDIVASETVEKSGFLDYFSDLLGYFLII